ncbi:EboA domain-containing protein [Isoptericola sp. S6320L]|uniref:EboA domain-containing protein n=1 Tax=Isoptericola sp. S6320L TaxID=2926411 RepID=UPI001FF242B8|nr:EboA domain-containing protein [Isoptericola sp. S6320L]MCK0116730.1 EboA domain-containing protein [Isoptericola sp. S6320L]
MTAEERLAALVEEVRHDPAALPLASARAARVVGRGPGLDGRRIEDVARSRLLVTACEAVGPDGAADVVAAQYAVGDADERRAVLMALPELADRGIGDGAVPVVLDALRTNDTRLVAAAMGPYAAAHLPADAWRHGVLKCLFTGVPLAAVADLDVRRDAELDRMVRAFAEEREAAGRDVPADAHRLLAAADR